MDANAKRAVLDQLAERAMGRKLKTRAGGELHGRLEAALRSQAVSHMSPRRVDEFETSKEPN